MTRRINKQGYITNYGKLEHREIYQTYYHCCLLKGIDIDHINGDKTDNRIENLRPVKKGQHSIMHHKGKKYRKTQNRICMDCGTKTSPYKDTRGYETWNRINGNYICRKCYTRFKIRERELDNPNFKMRHPKIGNVKPSGQIQIGDLEMWDRKTSLPNVVLKSGKLDANSEINYWKKMYNNEKAAHEFWRQAYDIAMERYYNLKIEYM